MAQNTTATTSNRLTIAGEAALASRSVGPKGPDVTERESLGTTTGLTEHLHV